VNKGFFLGYFDTSKAYKVFNSKNLLVAESIHVKFIDGLTTDRKLLDLEDDFVDMQIGPSVAPKIDKVKLFDEMLPYSGESSSQ